MKKKILFIIFLLILLFVFYIIISLASIKTANTNSMKVLSYKVTDSDINLKIGIGISSHVLVNSHYQIDNDKIFITVKKAPIWTIFFFKNAQIEIEVPVDSSKNYRVFLTDGNRQTEVEVP